MPSLRDLQRGFADDVLQDESRSIHAYIQADRFSAERHLQIYRHNVLLSLTEAIKDVFPVITRLVGEDFLGYAADHFIRSHLPQRANLHDFGEKFPAFLEKFDPATDLMYLPDVARLEWAYHTAFHAADAEPLTLTRLAEVAKEDYPRLRFMLHPSASLLASPYPILAIWQANQDDAFEPDIIDLNQGENRLLIIRRDLEVEFEFLDAGEHQLLTVLRDRQDFELACAQAMQVDSKFDLNAALQHHVTHHTITDFVITD